MATMLIAQNETRESGSFMGDQLCSLKAAYMFVENQPDVDRVIMSVSPGNEMHFLWTKFIDRYGVELIYDDLNPGDWPGRWALWDKWRIERNINGIPFDHYRELYLRIHGAQRQNILCGSERGLGKRNIYSYWYCGQEHCPDELPSLADWFDDTLIDHPPRRPERDVYISPHAKTQGNLVFTFAFWEDVVRRLLDNGLTVTVGYDGWFGPEFDGNPNYCRFWGTHLDWMGEVCKHRLVACGNTGTGWLAAACGTPMITMEPHNSVMVDHRFRECGLRNIIEVVDGAKLDEMHSDMTLVAAYTAKRIIEETRRCVVMTTGCYDILHAGHVRHLERARAIGTKLIVALNSDESVKLQNKGPERPINPQGQRKAVLEALRCVDEVRVFDTKDALHIIREIKPDVLACGYGYKKEQVVGREFVESYGGRVVITCEGDARTEPSTTKIVRRVRNADTLGAVRAATPYSVNPPEKLRTVATEYMSVCHLTGAIADVGSYRGGSALVLRKLAIDKELHLFDTWRGNPFNDPLCHHGRGEWAASLADCKKLVGEDEQTHYHEGVFPLTTSELGDMQFCFAYIDVDTYQSTLDALDYFWTRMVSGGKILVDDYGWEPCAGVRKAVDEYFAQGECGCWSVRVMESVYTWIVEKP